MRRGLLASAERRLAQMLREGLTTIEIKSGYGLDEPTEARMLRVARALGNRQAVTVRTSYLAAHALPPEFDGDADGYVARICGDWLPSLAAEGLVDAVDGFCETIAFDTAQISCVFETALGLGLPVKLHADQLTNGGGAALAASFGALSADHLEYTDEAGVAAMAEAGTVAVLLPGAYYFLRESQAPPVAAFRQHNVPIAVATDCNPGSSPLTSPLLTLNMAATMFRLTVEECLCGMTRNAARALGLTDRGTIAPGRRADLAIWDVETPAELVYRIGFNPCHGVIAGGAWRKETA